MNEQTDAELRQMIKEGLENQLEGWEFTPEMRRSVHARIHTSRRLTAAAYLRPAVLTAAAVAAVLLTVNAGRYGIQLMGSQASKSKSAPTSDTAALTEQPVESTSAAPPATAMAPTQPSEVPSAAAPADSTGSTVRAEPSTGVATAASAKKQPLLITLQRPPAVVASAVPQSTGGVTLRATPAPVPAAARLSLKASGTDRLVELQTSGLRVTDWHGASVWTRPLPGLTQSSVVAISPDGRIAVSAGQHLYIVEKRGELTYTLERSSAIQALTWSADGRLAVVDDTGVSVYRDANLLYRLEGALQPELRFTPDGNLVLVERRATGESRLTLIGQKGARILSVTLPTVGRGLVTDANLIIAGGQALTPSGEMRWLLPIQPDGLLLLQEASIIVGWNAQTVVAVSATDGSTIWQATLHQADGAIQQVVASPDGQKIALLAATDGAAVWVLDSADGRVGYSQALPIMPVGMALLADRLALSLPDALVLHDIAQP